MLCQSLCNSVVSFEQNSRDGNGSEEGDEIIGELSDGNFPGVGFKAEIEDDLGCDTVDGAVEEPPFDCKSEHRQSKVR